MEECERKIKALKEKLKLFIIPENQTKKYREKYILSKMESDQLKKSLYGQSVIHNRMSTSTRCSMDQQPS